MDIDTTYKKIRTLYQTILGKEEADVSITYRGTSHGITKPWHARVGDRECNNESHDGALSELLNLLKKELASKTASAELEAVKLREILNKLGN